MSLQAKIEAVIYASEEPVTLPQLMGLLGEEAQAELDALDSQQTSLALGSEDELDAPAGEAAGDEDALNAEVLEHPGLGDEDSDPAASPEDEGAASADTEVQESGPGAPDGEVPTHAAGAPTSDEKKRSRERERRLREHFRSLLDRLMAEYLNADRGLEIREVAGGFRMATKPEYHDAVRGFVKSLKPPLKLSLQALETLAVIAYKQPVTAPEIGEIRGVDSGGVLGSLMARKLITTAGRKAVIGRPILYKTTREFLVRFGLKDINELPSIEEFEKMAAELGSDGTGAVQEEIPMDEASGGRVSVEMVSGDGSPVLDELNTAPAGPTVVHESAEEMMTDQASARDLTPPEPSSGVSADAAWEVEQMADIHEPQADGDSTPTEAAQENPGDDAIVDGRISGIPPKLGVEEIDNPSAQEAAEQAAGGGGE